MKLIKRKYENGIQKVQFNKINIGDFFIYKNKLYKKTEYIYLYLHDKNAVDMEDGSFYSVDLFKEVYSASVQLKVNFSESIKKTIGELQLGDLFHYQSKLFILVKDLYCLELFSYNDCTKLKKINESTQVDYYENAVMNFKGKNNDN